MMAGLSAVSSKKDDGAGCPDTYDKDLTTVIMSEPSARRNVILDIAEPPSYMDYSTSFFYIVCIQKKRIYDRRVLHLSDKQ